MNDAEEKLAAIERLEQKWTKLIIEDLRYHGINPVGTATAVHAYVQQVFKKQLESNKYG